MLSFCVANYKFGHQHHSGKETLCGTKCSGWFKSCIILYTMLEGAFRSCNFESGATWKHVRQSWYCPWPFVQIHTGKKAASMKCQDMSSRHVWYCSENSSAWKRGTNMRENNFYFLFSSYTEHQMGEQNISTKKQGCEVWWYFLALSQMQQKWQSSPSRVLFEEPKLAPLVEGWSRFGLTNA